MRECIIGIDAGTASVKGLLVDASGTIIATASAPIRLSTPRPGWAEQSPEDWWKATIQLLDTLTVDRNLEILAVSISGQMHCLVPLDTAGDVVRPASLLCAQHPPHEVFQLTEACGGEQEVIKTFGNPVLTGFTAPKLLWLRTNEPDNFARIARFCLPKDYLVLKLTGRLAIEPSDASGTSLYRVREGVWDDHILDVLTVRRSMLPDLVGVGSVIGAITCLDLPRLRGVPVVAGERTMRRRRSDVASRSLAIQSSAWGRAVLSLPLPPLRARTSRVGSTCSVMLPRTATITWRSSFRLRELSTGSGSALPRTFHMVVSRRWSDRARWAATASSSFRTSTESVRRTATLTPGASCTV